MPQPEVAVAQFNDLSSDGLHQAEINGEAILLLRDGDTVRAVSATCPHAGAPLAQGVRNRNRIVCQWHKAAFCARSGKVLEPPALDPLQRYDVRVENGSVLVSKPAAAAPRAAAVPDTRCFVIVGAGAAGAVAAQTLREEGFTGRVVMLDAANRVPYDRTILSKYALSGEKGAEKSPLQSQAFYREHAIERRTAQVSRLDTQARHVICSDGTVLDYDAVLLATGGTPTRPNLPGADLAHVYTVRSLADAAAILKQAERSERAVVLGTSFIGMEVAASLRERGLDVTIIGKESQPFEKQLGAQVGGAFARLHRQHGVAFRLGRHVAAIEGGTQVTGVTLDDGETLPADLVVIGFGVAPATTYADALDRNDDGGINVDANLGTADGVYAAGDIACFPYRGEPVRVEHWRVAQQQGRVAALNMLGRRTPFDAVPFFWTIQYMKRLDYVGHASKWDSIVLHGDISKPAFLAYYVADGYVAAAAGMGRDEDTAALLELFAMRKRWGADELGGRPLSVLRAL